MQVIEAPSSWENIDRHDTLIFLGGSIEQGTAEQWQNKVILACSDIPNITILNPRRSDWDSTWKQDPVLGSEFRKQVDWELEAQDNSDLIVYYFDHNTKSPITLLELGIYSQVDPDCVIVCCPTNYWRYGNVAIVCERYGVTLVHSLDDLIRILINAV